MTKRLYTGFSFSQFIWTLLLRLAAAFGLIYSLLYYAENPVVISIVAILCLFFIIIIGDDQIVIYKNKVTQSTNSLLSLIFKNRGKSYIISEIKSAYLPTLPTISPGDIVGAVALGLILPKNDLGYNKTFPIFFDLKNGETVKFDTDLGTNKREKIVSIINTLVSQNYR